MRKPHSVISVGYAYTKRQIRTFYETIKDGSLFWKLPVNPVSMEALERFSEDPGRFDLVITDLSMPDMTGEKLVREIINIRPGMPVIMCSGFDATIRREKARELGARAFIRKPLTFEKLARTVRKALDD